MIVCTHMNDAQRTFMLCTMFHDVRTKRRVNEHAQRRRRRQRRETSVRLARVRITNAIGIELSSRASVRVHSDVHYSGIL